MPDLPTELFARDDNSSDANFYREPRFVTHIDPATIDQLTHFYREFLPEDGDLLDLMSSWISHYPQEVEYGRVSGLGMNAQELAANPLLDDYVVHDLNEHPRLPFDADLFDAVTITVSIQYLIHPVEVLSSVREVLKDDGKLCIAMSHRLFPTKAIAAFTRLAVEQRIRLVGRYLETAGFVDISYLDRSPSGAPQQADPLWLVTAKG